jgi:hypothetical protein
LRPDEVVRIGDALRCLGVPPPRAHALKGRRRLNTFALSPCAAAARHGDATRERSRGCHVSCVTAAAPGSVKGLERCDARVNIVAGVAVPGQKREDVGIPAAVGFLDQPGARTRATTEPCVVIFLLKPKPCRGNAIAHRNLTPKGAMRLPNVHL